MRNAFLAIVLCFFSASLWGQSIQLVPGTTFHDAVWGSEFGDLEDTSSPDEGGLLYLMVRNTTSAPLSIANVDVHDLQGTPQTFDGWYAWPDTIAPGRMTTISVKAINAPLAEGADARIVVTTSDNATHTYDLNDLTTPDLRLANAIPSQDRNTLWLYLRNDGTTDVELDSVYFNDLAYRIPSGQLVTLYGSDVLEAGEMRIIRVQLGLDLSDLATYAIRVRYNTTEWVSASIRITPPEYPIGSWHSSGANPENEFGRKRMRKVGVEMLQGLGNYSYIANANEEYFIRAIREPYFGEPFDPNEAIPEIQSQAQNTDIIVWTVDDEPDLNGKPIDQQLAKAAAYRNNDDDTPIHINLAVQKKFQRYGWYSDIVSMDHYAAPSAPNVIPLTYIPFVGRMSEIEEAYEYSYQLKLNTEPRRMWSWVQFAASTWDVQPEPIAVNYQFWAHVAAGAKGMEYFVAQSLTQDQFPELWDEGLELFKEFKQIRNACLYGEPADIVTSSNPAVKTYALQGPDAIVVVALNNSIEFSGNQVTGFTTDHAPQVYGATVTYPNWFPLESVHQITPAGKIPVDHNVNSATQQIYISPETIDDRAQVFIISRMDTEPPMMPQGLNVAEYVDSANYTLSWKEPFDNMGVKGYRVHYNGVLVGDVAAPLFEVDSQTVNCSGYYRITPYDNTNNFGEPDSVQFILNGVPLEITGQPQSDGVSWNVMHTLSVETNALCGYQWQWVPPGQSGWVDVQDGQFFSGAQTCCLTFNTQAVDLGAPFRCVVMDPCGGTLTSEIAEISVLGIEEASMQPLEVYPNPTTGEVWINLPDDRAKGSIYVYDATGAILQTMPVQPKAGPHRLSLDRFSNGLYVFIHQDNDGTRVARCTVVKQ